MNTFIIIDFTGSSCSFRGNSKRAMCQIYDAPCAAGLSRSNDDG